MVRTKFHKCAGLAVALPLVAALLLAGATRPAAAHPVSWEVYYTRFAGSPNLRRTEIQFDGQRVTLGPRETVAAVEGADGLVFAPDGDLLVGGQGNRVHKVSTRGDGAHTTVGAAGQEAFHLSLDPSGQRAWTSGMPGHLVEIPLRPFSGGVAHLLSGDDRAITSIAFDERGRAFYTSGDHRGGGNFGRLDLESFSTRRILSSLPAAHAITFDAITFDAFTGDLFLFGADQIAQIDPDAPQDIKSLRVVDQQSLFDQGTADGEGHLVIARTSGHVVFIDYAVTGLVGDESNFMTAVFVDSNLDDIAPLAGLGANPTATVTPAAQSPGGAPVGPGEVADDGTNAVASEPTQPDTSPSRDSAIPWALIVLVLANLLILTLAWGIRMLLATAARARREAASAAASEPATPPVPERPSTRQREANLLQVARRAAAGLLDGTKPRELIEEILRETIAATDSSAGAVRSEANAKLGHEKFDVQVGAGTDADDTTGPKAKPLIDLSLFHDGTVLGHLTLSRASADAEKTSEAALAPLAAVLTAILEKANTPKSGRGADDAGLFGGTAKMLRQSIETLEAPNLNDDNKHASSSPDEFRRQLDSLKEIESLLARVSTITFDGTREEATDLSAIAEEVAAALRESDPERSTRITIAPNTAGLGNPGRLKVAVEGLLGAAWHATSDEDASLIEFGITDRGGRAVCYARCHGPTLRPAEPGKPARGRDRDGPLPAPELGLSLVRYALGAGEDRAWTEREGDSGPAFFFGLPGRESGPQPRTGWQLPGGAS